MEVNKTSSEFNAAFKFTVDINSGFIDAAKQWANQNYKGSFNIGSSLQIVLIGYMSKDKYDELNKQFYNINSLFNKYSFQISKGSYPEDLIIKIKEYLESLVKVWKDSGLQNKEKDDLLDSEEEW
jgi:hypothetical protein